MVRTRGGGVVRGRRGGHFAEPAHLSTGGLPLQMRNGQAASAVSSESQDPKQKRRQTAPSAVSSVSQLKPGISHFVTLFASVGEDIAMKIQSFSNYIAPASFCVVSAYGSLASLTISAGRGTTVEYEGNYEVTSLSVSKTSGNDSVSEPQPISMHISFCNSNGKVIGGRVGGPIVAASPFKLVFLTWTKSERF